MGREEWGETMQTQTLQLRVEGMSCEHCVAAVTAALLGTNGVTRAAVSLQEKRATVVYDGDTVTPEMLIAAVSGASYEASLM